MTALMAWQETANRCHTTERHIRHLVTTRRIPFLKVGGLIRFDPDAIDAWLAEHTVPVGGSEG
jgi:excisionase family DNA binding protein